MTVVVLTAAIFVLVITAAATFDGEEQSDMSDGDPGLTLHDSVLLNIIEKRVPHPMYRQNVRIKQFQRGNVAAFDIEPGKALVPFGNRPSRPVLYRFNS
nr:hypothetical protein AAVH_24926 [Aphelenchus avenae]